MKTYARVDGGIVVEIIGPMVDDNGDEIEIDRRFTPQFVATLVDITTELPMPSEGWRYDGETFSEAD